MHQRVHLRLVLFTCCTSEIQGNLSNFRLTTLHLDSAAIPWQVTTCASWAQSSTKQMVGNMIQKRPSSNETVENQFFANDIVFRTNSRMQPFLSEGLESSDRYYVSPTRFLAITCKVVDVSPTKNFRCISFKRDNYKLTLCKS